VKDSRGAKIMMPLFYVQAKIFCIDDEQAFLSAAERSYEELLKISPCNSPTTALSFFEYYKSPITPTNSIRAYTEHKDYDLSNKAPTNINLSKIYNLKGSGNLQNTISIAIVDYNSENFGD